MPRTFGRMADPPNLPVQLCVRCATGLAAGDQVHNCIETDPERHPAAYLRDWRCQCPCQAG